jgi:hypothetical protein
LTATRKKLRRAQKYKEESGKSKASEVNKIIE